MKVSEFKSIVSSQENLPVSFVEVNVRMLFFGNRPQSVDADRTLTREFLKMKGLDSNRNDACIIITNTDPVSDEDKKLSPRDFVEKHMDEFEIAVQIL